MNKRPPGSSLGHQTGLTLLEILVALTAGLLLLGAVLAVYVTSNQTSRQTDNSARLQENARYAFNAIEQAVRMTGFSGCAQNGNVFNLPNIYALAPPSDITGANGGSTGLKTHIAGTDVLVVRGATSQGAPLIQHTMPGTFTVANNCMGLRNGDQAIITNCDQSWSFQIQNSPAGNCATGANNQTDITSPSAPANNYWYKPGDMLFGYTTRTFYLTTNNNGIPALFLSQTSGANTPTPQDLVEGVTDMQVLYGEDTTVPSDGYADAYNDASAVANWANVVSVRITLTLSTGTGGSIVSKPFTTTIALRNRLP